MGVTPGRSCSAGATAPSTISRARRGWTVKRVVAVLSGATLTLAGSTALAAGGAMLWADRTQRTDGMVTTPQRHYSATTHALLTEHLGLPDLDLGWVGPGSVLGRVRIAVTANDRSPYFVGIGRAAEVSRYLDGASYSRLPSLTTSQQPVPVPGARRPAPPDRAGIWVASTSGPAPRTLSWSSAGRDWRVVIMRADGSAGIDVAVRAAAEVPALPWLAGGISGSGGLLLLVGMVLMVVPVSRAAHRDDPGGAATAKQPVWLGAD
jgi:hypothetical protein